MTAFEPEHLASLVELTDDLTCVGGADGYFYRVSPSWTRVLGYSEEELRSRPFLDFVHPEDMLATAHEVRRVFLDWYVLPSGPPALEELEACEEVVDAFLEAAQSPQTRELLLAVHEIFANVVVHAVPWVLQRRIARGDGTDMPVSRGDLAVRHGGAGWNS